LITPSEHSIIVSPIGDLDTSILKKVGREINRIFGCQTQITPLLQEVGFALDPGRNQHHSTSILEKLSQLAPLNATKILAITQVDLFIPILTYVYGEAQLGGKAAIISTYRLKEDLSPLRSQEKIHHRTAKEAIHELGHTFNLRHCRDSACIMHYCRTIRDVDRKSDQFCRYCKILLEDEIRRMEGI